MTCEEHLTAMVEYLRGELEPLQQTRLESHLGHCDSCAAARDQLASGLEAAQNWQPELDAETLERRIARLAPYMEPRPERISLRLAWIAGAMATAALIVALGLVIGSRQEQTLPEEPTTVFDFSDGIAFDVGEPALTRHQPTAHVRLIAPRDWDGAMVREGRRTTIDMSRGFVAVAFAGGKGRRLRVITPSLRVDVIGTRFVVDVAEDGITTVAVSQGKVRVNTGRRATLVAAGQVRAVDTDGQLIAASAPPSIRYLEDEYLVEHTPPARRRRARAEPPSGPAESPAEPAVAISDVLDQLARAEELANDDQVAAAVTIFESCAEDAHPSYHPYRDLCRLQLARLVGFKQGRLAQARALLRRLSQNRGQVGREAALALCELELAKDPCAAKACLEEMATGDDSARREAAGLLGRWNLEERACQ